MSPPIYLPSEIVGDPVDRAAMVMYRQTYDFLRRKKSFTMSNAALLARLAPIKTILEVDEDN